MQKNTLKAEKRKVLGRKVKKLRREGVLPANIYGKKIKSLSIKFPVVDFEKVYKAAGETGIVEIAIGKQKKPVLISNVQLDPVTDKPLHVDFHQVDLKEKTTADVPIELIGESPAEKQGLGTVVQSINEIEVEALPKDLPDKFEIDQAEQIIVKVEPPRKEEEVAPPPPEEEVPEEAEKEVSPEEAAEKAEEKPEAEEKKEEETKPSKAKKA
jgi:large subunit ribosomal protein L25